MTPEPTPWLSTGLLKKSCATALLVMPTTDGPTAAAARTVGVLRASERLSRLACCVCWALLDELLAGVVEEPSEQPANVAADSATARAMASFLDLLAFSF